jgi:hypothetical protein
MSFFEIGSLRTVCWGWLQTEILLISAFRVARITDVSHLCLTLKFIFVSKVGGFIEIEKYIVGG